MAEFLRRSHTQSKEDGSARASLEYFLSPPKAYSNCSLNTSPVLCLEKWSIHTFLGWPFFIDSMLVSRSLIMPTSLTFYSS